MNVPAREKRPRRWLRWLVIAAAALVVVVIAAWVIVAVAFPPQRLRAMFTEHVSARLDREVRFADARLSLWPPVRVTVVEPELAEPGGFARGAAVRAHALHFDLELFALLARRVVVRRLVLDQPALHLVLREDGTTNFDGLGAGGQSPGAGGGGGAGGAAPMPVDFLMREFLVRGGKLLIDDAREKRRTVFDLETRTRFSLSGGRVVTSGDSRIHGLGFGPVSARTAGELNMALANLDWNVEHRAAIDLASKRIAIERLALVLGRAEAVMSGAVAYADDGVQLNLSARGQNVDLREVLGYLAAADAAALEGIEGDGDLAFDLALRGGIGSGRTPVLGGTLRVEKASFHYPNAPAGVSDLSFVARLGRDSLRVEALRARVADQPIEGEAEVIGAGDPAVSFALAGRLDLAAVSRMIGPADTQLAGVADVDLRGRGHAKDAGTMDLDGRVALAGVRVETADRRFESVQGVLTFSKQRATARGLEAHSGASSFTLDATVTRPLALTADPGTTSPAGVDFTLRSPYLDLAELLPATPGSPLLPNARGSGEISIARLKNENLDVRDVSARVRIEPGVVTADPFQAAAYGGLARGALAADFSRPDAPKISVKAQLDSARVDSLLSTWTGAGGLLKGTLVTNLDISAAGLSPEDIQRSLTGEGEILLLNGVLGPAPVLGKVASLTRMQSLETLRFRDARSPFRIEHGRVLTGPAALHGNFGDAVLAGAVGFDGSLDYVASLTIPKSLVAQMGAEAALAAGALSDDEGNVLLDVRIGGSAKNPTASLDQKAMADRLAGKAMKLIQRQGQGFEKKLFDALGIAPAGGDTTGRDSSGRDTAAVTDAQRRQLEKQLKSKAQDLLRGFLGEPSDSTKK